MVSTLLMSTPTAAFAGEIVVTFGAVVSPASVVPLQPAISTKLRRLRAALVAVSLVMPVGLSVDAGRRVANFKLAASPHKPNTRHGQTQTRRTGEEERREVGDDIEGSKRIRQEVRLEPRR